MVKHAILLEKDKFMKAFDQIKKEEENITTNLVPKFGEVNKVEDFDVESNY